MPRWMRVREFFVIHVVATGFIIAFVFIAQIVACKPMTRAWYVDVVMFPAFIGLLCALAAPGRALFLIFLGFSRDRRLLWFAFGHLVLTAVQVSSWYFCKR